MYKTTVKGCIIKGREGVKKQTWTSFFFGEDFYRLRLITDIRVHPTFTRMFPCRYTPETWTFVRSGCNCGGVRQGGRGGVVHIDTRLGCNLLLFTQGVQVRVPPRGGDGVEGPKRACISECR